jgi:hypothetical protein
LLIAVGIFNSEMRFVELLDKSDLPHARQAQALRSSAGILHTRKGKAAWEIKISAQSFPAPQDIFNFQKLFRDQSPQFANELRWHERKRRLNVKCAFFQPSRPT